MTEEENKDLRETRLETLLYYGVDGSNMSAEEIEYAIHRCRCLMDSGGGLRNFPGGIKAKTGLSDMKHQS